MHTYDYGLEWKNMKIEENVREIVRQYLYVILITPYNGEIMTIKLQLNVGMRMIKIFWKHYNGRKNLFPIKDLILKLLMVALDLSL